jgi:hypothetical protein
MRTPATFTPLEGGTTTFALTGPRLDPARHVVQELMASGVATSYRSDREAAGPDGRWTVEPAEEAPFATRVIVRRPVDPAAFNGTVVLEWFNVTAVETGPDWAYLGDELLRGGYAYVGASIQAIAIEGGQPAIPIGPPLVSLREADPARYGALHHPGDAWSYDVLTQIGRGLLEPGNAALAGLVPERLLAVGESQSAFRLVTYVNAIHPLEGVFDGFFLHSRGRAGASLGDGGRASEALVGDPIPIRTDTTTPVITVEAEGDLIPPLDFAPARQPDTDTFRLWEMAGTAHADRYLAGDIGELLGAPAPINAGPAHYLLKSALRHLDRWVRGDGPPPIAPRVEIDADGQIVRDEHGNARGGIRTPAVDVPAGTHSGEPQGDQLIFQLFGSTTWFTPQQMADLYGTAEAYIAAFDASLDAAVAAGWVLPEDRDGFAAEARTVAFP